MWDYRSGFTTARCFLPESVHLQMNPGNSEPKVKEN